VILRLTFQPRCVGTQFLLQYECALRRFSRRHHCQNQAPPMLKIMIANSAAIPFDTIHSA